MGFLLNVDVLVDCQNMCGGLHIAVTCRDFFFLVLLMIIKLDFKRFNMLFLDSCQPSQFFLYNFLKIENLSRFQIKQLRKWTLNNRVSHASTRTKCVFNKTEVSHLFHTISLIPVMQSRSAMSKIEICLFKMNN